jgi:predicted CopG family antitoxin
MKTISISISDLEYQQFGIKNDQFSFSEFVDIINKEITKQTLNRSILLAEKYKISRMSMDEITEEVKAVRNAKNNHCHQCAGFIVDTKKLPVFHPLPLCAGKSCRSMYF